MYKKVLLCSLLVGFSKAMMMTDRTFYDELFDPNIVDLSFLDSESIVSSVQNEPRYYSLWSGQNLCGAQLVATLKELKEKEPNDKSKSS